MASVCDDFHANIWRPSICVNCYKLKSQHLHVAPAASVRDRSNSCLVRVESSQSFKRNITQKRRRSRTVSPSPEESKLRQIIAERKMAVVEVGQMPALAGRLPTALTTKPPLIGVVKPYAVVDIDAESKDDVSNIPRRHSSEPNIHVHSTSALHASQNGSGKVANSVRHKNDNITSTTPSILQHAVPECHLIESELNRHAAKAESSRTGFKRHIRRGSVEPLESTEKKNSRVSVTRSHSFRRNRFEKNESGVVIVPRKKAPAPPPRLSSISSRSGPSYRRRMTSAGLIQAPPSSPHPIRRNSISTHMKYTVLSTQMYNEKHLEPKDMSSRKTAVESKVVLRKESSRIKEKRRPPEKPPRTLSTFISSNEQNDLVLQLNETADNVSMVGTAPNPSPSGQLASDDSSCKASSEEYLIESSVVHSLCITESETCWMEICSLMSEALGDTLKHIYSREIAKVFCDENLWQVAKEEIAMESESGTASYRASQFSTQALGDELEDNMKQVISTSQLIPPHPNLCLIRVLLPGNHSHGNQSQTALHDYTTGDVSTCILPQKELLDPQDYTKLVTLCLVQIFSALEHLYNNGVCHRDVGLENLLVTQVGSHWLIRLANFNFALQRAGPVTATTFVYGYQELRWLGGTGSRLPPEVIDTPDNAQTVDYSHTDCFGAGCLIYELMGEQNPFERDTELVYYQYTDIDFPVFENTCSSTGYLQRLALLLLKRDQKKRVSASTALLICQSILWLPHAWLEEPSVSEVQLRHHLELERARLVSELAKRDNDSVISLPQLLKAQFLINCNPTKLVRAYSVFSQPM